jgi:hypothetical protein
MIDFFRPSCSPNMKANTAPNAHPISYIAVTSPVMVGSGLPSVFLKRSPPRMPPNRPWSSCEYLARAGWRRRGYLTSNQQEVKTSGHQDDCHEAFASKLEYTHDGLHWYWTDAVFSVSFNVVGCQIEQYDPVCVRIQHRRRTHDYVVFATFIAHTGPGPNRGSRCESWRDVSGEDRCARELKEWVRGEHFAGISP